MTLPKIYFPFSKQAQDLYWQPWVLKMLDTVGQIIEPTDENQPWQAIPQDVQVIITGWGGPEKLPRDVWEKLPRLKAIGVFGGSPIIIEDAIQAAEQGIVILSASQAIAQGVAEEAVGLMIASQYELVNSASAYRQTGQLKVDHTHRSKSVGGSVVGLVGFGYVARQVAKLLAPFDSTLHVADPYIDERHILDAGGQLATLDTLFSESDIISIHAGWTPQTQGMVGQDLLNRVKPGALIVSTARMPLFDQTVLADKIREGAIRFASDFVPFDPDVWSQSDLHPNIKLVAVPAHTSTSTRTIEQMSKIIVQDLKRLFDHQLPQHQVSSQWISHTTLLVPTDTHPI